MGSPLTMHGHGLRLQRRNAAGQHGERHGAAGDQRPDATRSARKELDGRHGHVSRINQFVPRCGGYVSGKVRPRATEGRPLLAVVRRIRNGPQADLQHEARG